MAAIVASTSSGSEAQKGDSGGHPLQHPFVFWYMRRGKGGGSQQSKEEAAAPTPVPNPYESSIKQMTAVHTVEEFWSVYDWLTRPNALPTTTDLHFFRQGVKPTWEDPQNASGGKWLIRLRKGLASRYWEEMVLALVGQQLSHGVRSDEINGVVISIRYNEDIISIWNKHAHDREATDKLRDGIKKILRLPSHVHMEYKPHQTSLADKSSFRNTTVWKPKSARSDSTSASTGDPTTDARSSHMSRRSNSWGEREPPKRRTETERSWR